MAKINIIFPMKTQYSEYKFGDLNITKTSFYDHCT